jgi:putative FmdB family regulatory protein
MPIYEYQCQRCSHKLEVMQRISEAPLTTCPVCSEEALRKLISPVGFQLKGTGWYETDFKNKPKPKSDGGDKDGAGEKAKDSGDGESKPATKAPEASSAAD